MGKRELIGSVLVVGGGIAGVQASLELANSGYYVYLVEKSSAIGGTMAQLDKTFPTNDCSMCILSPKLVECGRHLNIELLTLTEVKEISGQAGNFQVRLKKYPRFIDEERCIACGICAQKCPKKNVKDEFNKGLANRKSIYLKYPQAVPLKYAIDKETCIYFKKGRCKACVKFCPADAVNLDDAEREITINVGSVILTTGFEAFDPSLFDTYNYVNLPNVATSLEFERILSASGPYGGHLQIPSNGKDRKEPTRIAWLQCVGSRDINKCDAGYCSAVCCMYAIKQAIIAKEHSNVPLETTIFFMDMRTYGKDFEKYYERAKQAGVIFKHSRIHTIYHSEDTGNLIIPYATEEGDIVEDEFDMVVLSIGLQTSKEQKELAEKLGIVLDSYNFAATTSFAPIETSRKGIFACGAFQGPKDIPSSVIEASAAAGASMVTLAKARFSLVKEKVYPEEEKVHDKGPRIGVFVCNCGVNIGGVVDVPAVRDFAKGLPHVAYVDEALFTCSQDTQEKIKHAIKENRLNRIVVAACSPRTHEPLFQETLREAGLNRYLFEMANIRDHNSWVHMNEPEKATEKAKDLVKMAVAKAALLEPLEEIRVGINKSAMVVGGGVAGMTTAINLAEQGFHTYLIEKSDTLGGNALNLSSTWKGEDVRSFLKDLIDRVTLHPSIEVLTGATITGVSGFVGNFKSSVVQGNENREIEHGVAILATGAHPVESNEYLYGKNPNVLKWFELDEKIENEPDVLKKMESAVFIQCVGSREPQRPYCSRICCTHAIHNAIRLKELNPDMTVSVLYRDIRTYGLREDLYKEARTKGVIFVRYNVEEKPKVEEKNGKLHVVIKDHVLGMYVSIPADIITLSTAIEPNDNSELARFFKVPLNDEKFFLEAHMKLRPVDFATDGVFVCGMAHYPKPLEESIVQAQAAAARAASILAKDTITIEPAVSQVTVEKCIGCGICAEICAFSAIVLDETEDGLIRAKNITASCKGCGLCAASCPQKAIDMFHFKDEQIMAAIDALSS